MIPFDKLPEDERVFYLAEDIKQGELSPWDLSRAWKLLVVFRDIALEQDPPDFDRTVIYSNVIKDLGTMIQKLDYPLPPIGNGINAEDLEKLREQVIGGQIEEVKRAIREHGVPEPGETRGPLTAHPLNPPSQAPIIDLTHWGEGDEA